VKIVADENIPYVREAFGVLGEVTTLAGRAPSAAAVRAADCLPVRSVTTVDEALLAGSRARFVGTATTGVDHVDAAHLATRGIPFASAPGSNANSVSEWLSAALLWLAARDGSPLAGRTLGIVGVGNVGRRVEAKARALGLRVLRNDPPRARAEGPQGFVDLGGLLAASDLVTVHVPLESQGEDRTEGLADAAFFRRMRPGSVFLNSSRGAVVDEAELRAALASGQLAHAILDVWQGEPEIAAGTLGAVTLGTPHIAGYSFDGKVAGTRMIYEAACQALGEKPVWDPAAILPPPSVPHLALDARGRTDEAVLHEAVRAVYAIEDDHRALAEARNLPPAEAGRLFTRLRKYYPQRHEFQHTTPALACASPALQAKAAGLGFRTQLKVE